MLVQLPIIIGLFEDATYMNNKLKNKYNYEARPEGTHGDLYNIFKERLQRIQQELSHHNIDYYDNKADTDSEDLYVPSDVAQVHSAHYRRETGNKSSTDKTKSLSVYPSVLTKALEISLDPAVNARSSGHFLANVAEQMNTSALGLAKELTKSSEGTLNNEINLSSILKNYVANNGEKEMIK